MRARVSWLRLVVLFLIFDTLLAGVLPFLLEVEEGYLVGWRGWVWGGGFGAVCWPNGADLAPDGLYEKVRAAIAVS